jgi:phenylpyruvate tautomerase PptA (4-oxalocrotonate tautomerase family)
VSGLRKICLAVPTHRACSVTIAALAAEAAYAAEHFPVEVAVLILDSTDETTFAGHAAAVEALPDTPNVTVIHLDEAAQRRFLLEVIERAGVGKPDLIVDLMLPRQVSYGACTNRVFLIGAALGCESVHRRDSDVAYQTRDGVRLFPIHHELTSLGRRAADVADEVSEVVLDPVHAGKPVVMVGGSLVGELSVDIAEIRQLDPETYYDIVSQWAAEGTSEQQKRALVEESFTGAGAETFTGDHSTLDLVDPMRVEMSNISFYQVQEEVPLPPMTETIGSDYFLIHLVPDSRLPGVLHNRNIINYYTPERKTESAFYAYHLRLAKFFLSMLYLHVIYQGMGEAGEGLLDEQHHVRAARVAEIVRASVLLDKGPNVRRLDTLERSYRRLGGRYAAFAELLAARRERLLTEAAQDIEDFATLILAWGPLIRAAKDTGPAWG